MLVLLPVLLLLGCQPERQPEVVVYTSQDQVYSSEILAGFERETGIRVKAVYDSELVKTVGLANRLIAEKDHPQCDVFWSNEELRVRQLEREGVFVPSEPPVLFGHRLRQLVIHPGSLAPREAPTSLEELTDPKWKGRVVMAYPLFGTTSTHMLVLREAWGDEKWEAWIQGLFDNDVMVVDGNSVVVRMVGAGEAWIGLTDSDDIHAGQKNGLPVVAVDLEETLLIPNAAAKVVGRAHANEANALLAYLKSDSVLKILTGAHALEGPYPEQVIGLKPDWDAVLDRLEEGTEVMKEAFLRD